MMMRGRRTARAGLLAAVALLAAAACSGHSASSTFTPQGGGPSTAGSGPASPAAATAAGYVMPPFGSNVHIDMTSELPTDAAEAAAVNADKSFQLAFLYAEYKGGQDNSWVNYVSSGAAQNTVQQSLETKDVTTESFTGTVKYFDVRVNADPATKGAYDVVTCFDDAGADTTNLTTGAVVPDKSAPDAHYMRIADELLKGATGQWQVVSSFPTVYYPEASECKP